MFRAMTAEENEYLVVYPGHNSATLLYKRLLKKLCSVELVSTPIVISYGCSQAVKFKEVNLDIVNEEIQKITIRAKGVYKIIKKKDLIVTRKSNLYPYKFLGFGISKSFIVYRNNFNL